MFISDPDRIRIRPKVSDPSGPRIRNTVSLAFHLMSACFNWLACACPTNQNLRHKASREELSGPSYHPRELTVTGRAPLVVTGKGKALILTNAIFVHHPFFGMLPLVICYKIKEERIFFIIINL